MSGRPIKKSPTPSWLIVLMEFVRIGATSFGGGSATIAAMRQLCLRRGWLTEREFMDTLVLSRLTPGISIVAQALLIGRAAGGLAGMIAGAIGLLVPSISITVFLAWLYERISLIPQADGSLHAIAGIAAGFAVALSLQLVKGVLRSGRFWLNAAIFAANLGLSQVVSGPLVLMGIAIAVAVAVPSLFDEEKIRKRELARTEKARTRGEAGVES